MNQNRNITSFSDLQGYAQGTVVELPPFAGGQPLVARIKRPSLMGLVKSGKIDNSLIRSANELFEKGTGSFNATDDEAMTKMFGVFDKLCEAVFLEPTYQEIQESGVELTDEQYLFIFQYTQSGVQALESFRVEQGSPERNSNEHPVSHSPKSNPKH